MSTGRKSHWSSSTHRVMHGVLHGLGLGCRCSECSMGGITTWMRALIALLRVLQVALQEVTQLGRQRDPDRVRQCFCGQRQETSLLITYFARTDRASPRV